MYVPGQSEDPESFDLDLLLRLLILPLQPPKTLMLHNWFPHLHSLQLKILTFKLVMERTGHEPGLSNYFGVAGGFLDSPRQSQGSLGQVAGTRTARYRAVPPKIDHRLSISAVDDRLKGEIDRRRSIEREKGKKKKKKRKKNKKRKEEKKNTYRPRAVLARVPSPPTGRRRFSSHAGRKIEA
ncbi:hypothetical protein B296_00033651, partial [Ensete ventricosum]